MRKSLKNFQCSKTWCITTCRIIKKIIGIQLQRIILKIILKMKEDKTNLNKTIKAIKNMNCNFANNQLCMSKIEILLKCFMMITVTQDSKLYQLIKIINHKNSKENNHLMKIKWH